jgi:hypothetical protein
MDRPEFLIYMHQLEQQVIIPGWQAGHFGRTIWLPIRNGKLHSSELAQLLGTRFTWPEPAAIDYYGLHKRSTGFMTKAVRLGAFLTGFDAPLIPFSAVHDEHIKALAPELLVDFSDFKREIIRVRFPDRDASISQ